MKNKLQIETKELIISETLKKKLEMICKFASVKPRIINGSIRNIKNTNVAYVEPHRLIVNEITYLLLDNCNKVFVSNLNKEIKLSELKNYIKKTKLY